MAIAGAVTLLDLDVVVIGGGVAAAGPLLFEPLARGLQPLRRTGFRRRRRGWCRRCSVGAAGLIGAAAVVLVPDAYWPGADRAAERDG